MANGTLKPTTPVLTGVTITAASGTIASSETMTISATTAQSNLNLAKLIVCVANANSTTSVTLSLGAGTEYSEKGQGAKSITVATETTVIIGGQDFESARFLTSSNTVVFTQTGTGPTTWTAFQLPWSWE